MQLTGIEIFAGGRWKFVGKVGLAPAHCVPAAISRKPIFYRETTFADGYSTATDSYSVDREAWQEAERRGAQSMVIFIKDRNETICISAGMINGCAVVDLGERPQIRIPESKIFRHYKTVPIAMGWTTISHKCPAIWNREPEPPKQEQLSMFPESALHRLIRR